jgi:muramoyltetrapeptide carboxypeptidase
VALVSPAGPIDEARLESAVAMCERLELVPVVGAHAQRRTAYLAGTDAERAADLQHAVSAPDIDAIWALRGGYGTARLAGRVDLHAMRDARKAYIGFSDNTTVHMQLARLGLISFHGPHAGGDFPPFAEQSFRRMLFDGSPADLAAPDGAPLVAWSPGVAEGILVGGNLAVIAAAEGTPYSIPSDGAILFIEDIAEPPYRIDRLLTQLAHSGTLARVAGFVIGQFTDCDSDAQSALDVVRHELDPLGVPVIANAPIGHVADNWTLPIAARVRVDANAGTLSLLEPVTSE